MNSFWFCRRKSKFKTVASEFRTPPTHVISESYRRIESVQPLSPIQHFRANFWIFQPSKAQVQQLEVIKLRELNHVALYCLFIYLFLKPYLFIFKPHCSTKVLFNNYMYPWGNAIPVNRTTVMSCKNKVMVVPQYRTFDKINQPLELFHLKLGFLNHIALHFFKYFLVCSCHSAQLSTVHQSYLLYFLIMF